MAAKFNSAILLLVAICGIAKATENTDHHKYSSMSELNRLFLNPKGFYHGDPDFASEAHIEAAPSTATATVPIAVIFNPANCTLYPAIAEEIQSYKKIVQEIVYTSLAGGFAGATYGNLSYFVDTYENRISGSDTLEKAIDYLKNQMQSFGLTNVRTENVPKVPAWKRGSEVAQLLTPRQKEIAIFGLGSTATTSTFGLIAEVVVFNSYLDLIANQGKAKNKIVVCNFGGPAAAPLDTTYTGYVEAVNAGAKAMLYRSATTFSLYSPHARRANLYYDGKTKEVPIAYLTFEDGDLMSRISARGQIISMYLNMQNTNASKNSRNLFGDLPGGEKADELVLLAGHSDNWDVGQGAQDDGFAIYLAMQGICMLNSLNLRPKRTIRAAVWTSEEYGYLGSGRYVQDHKQEFEKLNVAMEADYGCLLATGLIFNGQYELGCILDEILQLVGPHVTAGLLVQANSYKSDLDNFEAANVPVVSLNGDDGRYFWFHHTHADTMTAVNSVMLDTCLATWTATAYILADMQEMVPRGLDIPVV